MKKAGFAAGAKQFALSLNIGFDGVCAICGGEAGLREPLSEPGFVMCYADPEMANGLAIVCFGCGKEQAPALYEQIERMYSLRSISESLKEKRTQFFQNLNTMVILGTILHFDEKKGMAYMGRTIVDAADEVKRGLSSLAPDDSGMSEDEVPF